MFFKKITIGLFLVLTTQISNAAIITVDYSGTINFDSGLSSDLQTLLPVGTSFTGSYTYDSSSAATQIYNSNDYSYTGIVSDFSIYFDSYYASLEGTGMRFQNDTPTDTYLVAGGAYHPEASTNIDTNIVLSNYVSETINSGYHLYTMRLDITDNSGNMLSDALLSQSVPDLTGTSTSFMLEFKLDCCTGRTTVYGSIDSLSIASISTVPIPSAIWLFGSGLVGLIGVARRKKA